MIPAASVLMIAAIASAIGALVTLAACVAVFAVYAPLLVEPPAIPEPSIPDLPGGDPLEAAFALDAEPPIIVGQPSC
jgi:hypothetical protein